MTGRSTPGTWTNSRGVTMARLLAVVGSFRTGSGLLFCSASFCLAAARRFSTAARSARAICSASTAGSTASGSVALMCSILASWFWACWARSSRAARACSTVIPSGPCPPGGPGAAVGASGRRRRSRAGDRAAAADSPPGWGTTGVARVRGEAGTIRLAEVAGAVSAASCSSRSWRRVGGPPPARLPSFSASSLMVRSVARSRARTCEERSEPAVLRTESTGPGIAAAAGDLRLGGLAGVTRRPAGRGSGRRRDSSRPDHSRQGEPRRDLGYRPPGWLPGVHLWPVAVRDGCGLVAVPDSLQTHSVLAGWAISVLRS